MGVKRYNVGYGDGMYEDEKGAYVDWRDIIRLTQEMKRYGEILLQSAEDNNSLRNVSYQEGYLDALDELEDTLK